MKFIIVTGISGAGITTVLNTLEDAGYHCVDNMPVDLIPQFMAIIEKNSESIKKAAIGLDSRSAFGFASFEKSVEAIKNNGHKLDIIFVDCPDAIIINRYKETRRNHPLTTSKKLSLSDAVAEDRRLMADIKEAADTVIDTAKITSAQLKQRILSFTSDTPMGISVAVTSFGFKYGIPTDADLVFDVRCFPNPYYIESMRHHTGMEDEVYNYVFGFDEVKSFMSKLYEMLKELIPLYRKEGKTQLSVAIGCTGGKHRSVAIARTLAKRLSEDGLACIEIHRDIRK